MDDSVSRIWAAVSSFDGASAIRRLPSGRASSAAV